MAHYVIGDIHGCRESLDALLHRIGYRPGADRLWLCGDLVNRGPDSLGVLRWAREQGDSLVCVLGNHEVHLLGAALRVPGFRMRSAFGPILEAPDGPELLAWVASRPLLHREEDRVLVHAGLLPAWTLETAYGLSGGCEELLRGDGAVGLLAASRRGEEHAGAEEDGELARFAHFLQVVTLLRLVDEKGHMVPEWVEGPEARPRSTFPWFDAEHSRPVGTRIFFGHWAALGLMLREDAVCLDSGCVWGGRLSALRLDDGTVFQQELLDEAPRRW